MPTPAYVIDQTHHPEIEITWNRAAEPADLQAYFKELDDLLAQRRGLTMLFDIPWEAKFPAEQRVQMSRWLKKNEESLRSYVYGVCFVTASKVMGMFLRTIFVFAPPPHAYKITNSTSEGKSWCHSLIQQRARAS